jgi:hypothetical protein
MQAATIDANTAIARSFSGYVTAADLKLHQLAHNQEEKTPSRRPPVHIACPILHKCELCDHPVFATSFDLRLHKSFDHEEGDLAQFFLRLLVSLQPPVSTLSIPIFIINKDRVEQPSL